MQILIDESGNLGKAGDYFVIAALVPKNSKRIKNIISRSCVKFGDAKKPLDELHAVDLTLPQKQEVANKLVAKDDFSCSYIVAEKKHLSPLILKDKNLCFNYLAKYLFSKLVRGTSEDIEVIMDNHTMKVASVNSLADYIRLEAMTKWSYNGQITFKYMDSRDCKSLQAVDIIANSVYSKYSFKKEKIYQIVKPYVIHEVKFPYEKFGT